MPRVLHIVVTERFAGVERYVCDTASETARRGWDVAVVGGDADSMKRELAKGVHWAPGATPAVALRSVLGLGRWDICHVQMTLAEAVGCATRRVHGAPIVSTRNFPTKRGTSPFGRVVAPWIAKRVTREIATSEFIAENLERPPSAVIVSGVPNSPCLWCSDNRVVLVLQRLESEKDTTTALLAWHASKLYDEGWCLRVVGDGSQRGALERCVTAEAIAGVTFTGHSRDVASELGRAGMLLASAPAEPLGLSVIEAMAAGVPVVACGSGGHLETAGLIPGAPLFQPRDETSAAVALRSLRPASVRSQLSAAGRQVVAEHFTIGRHVDRLLREYESARRGVVSRVGDDALVRSA